QRMRADAIKISRVGNAHLLKAIVLQTPKRRAPLDVQRLNRSVARLQPVAERCLRRRAVIRLCYRLVVELPAPDCRMLAVAPRHLCDDALAQSQIGRICERVVAARAVFALPTVYADEKSLRILLAHPCRRARRRRAED